MKYRIKQAASVYPGKILEVPPEYEDEKYVTGWVHISRNRVANGMRQFSRDDVEMLERQ